MRSAAGSMLRACRIRNNPMELFADLHIHSCLSPCGDDDMTPCNIAGMAKIKGLDIIALTDHNTARNLPAMQEAGMEPRIMGVGAGMDAILARYGLVREGRHYRVETPCSDTIALFCHFGVECVLLSHLLNIAPPALWQGFTALTSSVTTVYTEEREEGTASFRCCSFGDLSHLYAHGEPPSFQARFCEVYSDNTRH